MVIIFVVWVYCGGVLYECGGVYGFDFGDRIF